VSVLEKALSTIKEVLLLRDQFKQMREEINRMNGNMSDMLDDVRDLEQRISRLEGVEKTMLAIVSRIPRLPEE
jgi:methyl-accepting chemotaxis protein